MVIKKFIENESPSVWQKITFFNESSFYVSENKIKRDVIRISRFYQRRGYNDVDVSYRLEEKNRSWKKELIFEVTENLPIRIDSVIISLEAQKRDSLAISGDKEFQKAIKELPYRKGKVYETVEKNEVEGQLVLILKNMGYAYAHAEVQAKVDTLRKKAHVALISYPGPRTYFDSVLVEGEAFIPPKYVRRETGIKKGEPFSEIKMRDAQREIFNHHLFTLALVSIPEQKQDSTLNVLVRVKELPLRSVQAKIGVGNVDRIEKPFEVLDAYKIFRLQGTWVYRNVRNKGERFSTSISASAYNQRFGTDYLFPYVFNTKSNIIISPFVQHRLEPSYEITQGGSNFSFVYLYNQNMATTFAYEFTLNNESDRKTRNSLPDSVLNYNVSSFSLSTYYTQGLKRKENGWIVHPYAEISGLLGEATFSFQKLSMDIRKYTQLTDNLTLANRIYGEAIHIDNAKSDSLPSNLRLYSGGSNSVRGYSWQGLGPKRAIFNDDGSFNRYIPNGGNAVFNFNIEFRQSLDRFFKGFGIATFLDGGQVWRSVRTLDESPVQYAVGGGLRYSSPLGAVRIDLAYKLNPTDSDLNIYDGVNYGSAWNRWGIHLSLGEAF